MACISHLYTRCSSEHIMSEKVKQNWCFIELITTASDIQVQSLLNTISSSQTETILEIVLNLLHRNILLTSDTITKLKKYKKFLRGLINKKISLNLKKKAIRRQRKVIVYLLQKVKPHLQP